MRGAGKFSLDIFNKKFGMLDVYTKKEETKNQKPSALRQSVTNYHSVIFA